MRLTAAGTAAFLVSLTVAATAFAHAELLRTDPPEGSTLKRSPRAVVLTFSEDIDPALVRLEVRDAAGHRVDRGGPFHPDGREAVVAVALAPRLVTDYGLLVFAKIVLLALLIALGAFNQRWALPRLRLLAAGGEEPGRATAMLRQSVALEVAFALVVIAVTSALVATEPANPD
jgi:methionine-rich copper-binding protein CopC